MFKVKLRKAIFVVYQRKIRYTYKEYKLYSKVSLKKKMCKCQSLGRKGGETKATVVGPN